MAGWMSEGRSAVAPEAAWTPFTNNFMLPPPMVTAPWVQIPAPGMAVSTVFSIPFQRIVKAMRLEVDLGVRKKYSNVPFPKSKSRCQMLDPFHIIHAAIVISLLLAMPAGSVR